MRALDILEAISQLPGGLTNGIISRRLGIPKSSASAILHVLQDRGYVCRYEDGGRYKLGANLLVLGEKVLETSDIHDLAFPFLRNLSQKFDLSCHLSILGRSAVVHVAKVVAHRHQKRGLVRSVGQSVPLYSTSVGKAILAWLPKETLEDMLRRIEISKFTERTIRTKSGLLAELHRVRAQSYAVDNEEWRNRWRCIGAPVFDVFGNTIVAICVAGTVADIEEESIPTIAPLLKETARKISAQFASENVRFASY
jgi:IclR family transcriptional regulator, KDG regulon repressor